MIYLLIGIFMDFLLLINDYASLFSDRAGFCRMSWGICRVPSRHHGGNKRLVDESSWLSTTGWFLLVPPWLEETPSKYHGFCFISKTPRCFRKNHPLWNLWNHQNSDVMAPSYKLVYQSHRLKTCLPWIRVVWWTNSTLLTDGLVRDDFQSETIQAEELTRLCGPSRSPKVPVLEREKHGIWCPNTIK